MIDHDPRLDGDDCGNDEIEGEHVHQMHFGGFADGEEQLEKKSYDERMQEIVAKSKFHKLERQKAKAENEQLRHDLNEEFKELGNLLFASASSSMGFIMPPADDYDKIVKELSFDRKAKPSNRMKTDDEIAKEKAALLLSSERKRIRRMKGLNSDTESEFDSDSEPDYTSEKLDLSFDVLPRGSGHSLQHSPKTIVSYKDDCLINHNNGEPSRNNVSDCIQESGYYVFDNEAQISSYQPSASDTGVESSLNDYQCAAGYHLEEDLPFTFKITSDYQGFLATIQGRTLDDQMIILDRVRTLHHPSLAPGNHEKLQLLLSHICNHFEMVCKYFDPKTKDDVFIGFCCIPPGTKFFDIINSYYSHIVVLAEKYPQKIAEIFSDRLWAFQIAYKERESNGEKLIQAHEFMVVSLIAHIFPTTDFHHHIVSPLFLLVSEWLSALSTRIPVLKREFYSGRETATSLASMLISDVCCGIFLCQLFIGWQKEALRWSSEPFIFLQSIIHCFNRDSKVADIFGMFPSFTNDKSSFFSEIGLKIDDSFDGLSLSKVLFFTQADELEGKKIWSQVHRLALVTFMALADLFQPFDATTNNAILDETIVPSSLTNSCWPEIFSESLSNLPEAFIGSIGQTKRGLTGIQRDLYRKRLELARRHRASSPIKLPLQWQRRKTLPIRMFAPKFEENYNLDRHYDPDQRRAEKRKISVLHKREMKGALRELRKDSTYLAVEQQRLQRERDQDYQSKIRRVYGILSAEKGEKKGQTKNRI